MKEHLRRLSAKLRGERLMPNLMAPVLFISHDALRTGAPMVLLHLIRWIKEHTSIPFRILLRSGGEMRGDFEALGPTVVFDEHGKQAPDAALSRFLEPRFQLLYSNTCVNGDVLDLLGGRGIPVISHIHELEKMIRYHVGYELFDRVKARTDFYVAASEAVKDNLVEQHHVDPERIGVIHEFIPLPEFGPEALALKRDRIRTALGIPPDAFVVGASGTTDWRKGPDLFVQLAHALLKRHPALPGHFLWVGGGGPKSTFYERPHHEYAHLQHDVGRAGLGGRVHFIGSVDNPIDHFCAMDVFASTSREDPFPVVCLEAGALGLPILCFDGAGGMKELVGHGCGHVVSYLDVPAMAERVAELWQRPEERQSLGGAAARRIREDHSVDVGARKILETMGRVLGKPLA